MSWLEANLQKAKTASDAYGKASEARARGFSSLQDALGMAGHVGLTRTEGAKNRALEEELGKFDPIMQAVEAIWGDTLTPAQKQNKYVQLKHGWYYGDRGGVGSKETEDLNAILLAYINQHSQEWYQQPAGQSLITVDPITQMWTQKPGASREQIVNKLLDYLSVTAPYSGIGNKIQDPYVKSMIQKIDPKNPSTWGEFKEYIRPLVERRYEEMIGGQVPGQEAARGGAGSQYGGSMWGGPGTASDLHAVLEYLSPSDQEKAKKFIEMKSFGSTINPMNVVNQLGYEIETGKSVEQEMVELVRKGRAEKARREKEETSRQSSKYQKQNEYMMKYGEQFK